MQIKDRWYEADKHLDNIVDELSNEKLFLCRDLFNSIEFGINNDILTMPIVNINFVKKNKKYILKCHRNNWPKWLKKIKGHLVNNEEYEKCIKINKLLSKLD